MLVQLTADRRNVLCGNGGSGRSVARPLQDIAVGSRREHVICACSGAQFGRTSRRHGDDATRGNVRRCDELGRVAAAARAGQ